MPVLTSQQRKLLEDACVKGRRASEEAVRAALGSLAVTAERPPPHLSESDRQLRRGLRAKSRQLGDQRDKLDLLIAECAYEQWHRLLFARFLAENNLLIHPEYRAPVSLEDCEELAESLGEPDGWSVAGRFAAEILPGIFRLNDPCVQLRLAPEGRLALEGIVAALPIEIFGSDDALGWVYQYWQREQKDEVNRSERKISGADIGPITQLFTENYMVRFLLENTLGAWWVTHHPNTSLARDWHYLRADDDGHPIAGAFESWPSTVAEVTVMDPCCGSGHFLVEAFGMLWRMRAEEEGLDPVTAQDAVLRDNLFGLELDPRCVQIAMFAVALQAWKAGSGWRQLPAPRIACSGVSVRAAADEWKTLAGGDARLENALLRLHLLFRDAESLGSLINPRRASEVTEPGLQRTLDDVDWLEVQPLLEKVMRSETADSALDVLGLNASALAHAAGMLSRDFTLVVTNVPYLHRGKHGQSLLNIGDRLYADSSTDLATMMMARALESLERGGALALVAPQNWLSQSSYSDLRVRLLGDTSFRLVARLGERAFESTSAAGAFVALYLLQKEPPSADSSFGYIDAAWRLGPAEKARTLLEPALRLEQVAQRRHPDARIHPPLPGGDRYLSEDAECLQGIKTGDDGRYRREFWELPALEAPWAPFLSSVEESAPFAGRSGIVLWEGGTGSMAKSAGSRIVGKSAWGRLGVHVSQMRDLPVSLYLGELFDTNASPIVPRDPSLVPAIWAFCQSEEYVRAVREIEPALKVTNATLVKVPFDVERWRKVAQEAGPMPEPWSDDPTQWLFAGRPEVATESLQVGVARLLGFRWPADSSSDDLADLADSDGIVCLPSVRGERTAAERVQELLARAFGGTWSPARTQQLLAASGSKQKDLDSWLREEFFKAHCQLFRHRPFIWQLWDGRKDGFAALANYHQLDRSRLEKLSYSYLGDWIERQAAGVRDDVAGAEERLAAARSLQQKLELILRGEPPYDIYVRWKSLAEQPIGWEPDLNDGVRMNIRPFVEAGVLRSKVNVKWDKDRGKNPDGKERLNNLHHTNAEKQAARGGSV